ncbi:hypothetical protein ES705_47227 [subsurface metagenome]
MQFLHTASPDEPSLTHPRGGFLSIHGFPDRRILVTIPVCVRFEWNLTDIRRPPVKLCTFHRFAHRISTEFLTIFIFFSGQGPPPPPEHHEVQEKGQDPWQLQAGT